MFLLGFRCGIKNLLKLLQEDKSEKKVCWGVDATVVAVAPYARSDYHSPVPNVLSPSDKCEKSAGWIHVVIDTWNTHNTGGIQMEPFGLLLAMEIPRSDVPAMSCVSKYLWIQKPRWASSFILSKE